MARSSLYPPSVQPGHPQLGEKPKGWIEATYGSILEVIQRPISISDDVEYQLVVAKRNRGGIVERSRLYGRDIKTDGQYLIEAGDFLISRRQIIHGACGIVPNRLHGAIVSGEYATVFPKDDISIEYLDLFSHSLYFQQTCFHASVGVDVEKMIFRLDEWFKFPVYLPPLPEQRAIAAILSTWDEAITLTTRLIDALKRRKQALMQLLLTGEVRFAEFDGEWEEVEIGDVAQLTAGGTPSTRIGEYWGGDIRWMSSGEVHQKRIYEVEGRITEAGLNNSSTKILPTNSVLVALAGQGKTRGTVAVNKVELATNQSIAAIIPDPRRLHYGFLFYNLDARYEELRRLSAGDGGRGGLNLQILKTIAIAQPPIEEQLSISDALEACDTEIVHFERYMELLTTQKHGLMQQLLTGAVRVQVGD